jgi:molybdenum-dependent DNA-binding transcriptional regulator ModE
MYITVCQGGSLCSIGWDIMGEYFVEARRRGREGGFTYFQRRSLKLFNIERYISYKSF